MFLMHEPRYAVCQYYEGSTSVIISDEDTRMVMSLDADTGGIINRHYTGEIKTLGVTCDIAGNVYVLRFLHVPGTQDRVVLTRDLSEEKRLLSEQDGLCDFPQAILHDEVMHKLIVTYHSLSSHQGFVDCFQLSC